MKTIIFTYMTFLLNDIERDKAIAINNMNENNTLHSSGLLLCDGIS